VAIYTNIPVQADVLEDLFKRFPDVPREVVLKVELLSLGHWFTDAALDATAGSQVKSYRLFSYDLVPMSQMERNESRKVPEYYVIFQGDYGLRPVIVQTTLDPNSPYVVDVVDGRLVLTANGRVLCNVAYPKAPGYYAKRTEQGVPYHEIIAYGFFTTVFRNCQYWGPKEECRFCDINENARQMKESHEFTLVAPVKPLEDVREVGLEVSREALATYGFQSPVTFLITGGTILCSSGSIRARPGASAMTNGSAACSTLSMCWAKATSGRTSSAGSRWPGRTVSSQWMRPSPPPPTASTR
jgi:hypothetical protein